MCYITDGEGCCQLHEGEIGIRQIILVVEGALPSKFDCQHDCKRWLSDANTSPDNSLKREKQQQDFVEECKQENIPHCTGR